MPVSRSDTQDRILALVRAILDRNSIVAELAPETRLAAVFPASRPSLVRTVSFGPAMTA